MAMEELDKRKRGKKKMLNKREQLEMKMQPSLGKESIITGVRPTEGKFVESKAVVGYTKMYNRSGILVKLVSFIVPFFESSYIFIGQLDLFKQIDITSTNMACNSSSWTWEQDKAFEIALAIYSEDLSDRWENIAAMVPGKTAEEIKQHYLILVEDINAIESGLVPLPCYNDSANRGGKKGIAWTEEEHRLFLLGLEKYGKGDWKSISRYFVVSRTPTQVASHAQKYFVRLSLANKERRRSSIHDITNVDGGDSSTPQGPITGEMDGGSSRRSGNPTPSTNLHVSIFIPPTIVESTDSPLISETDIPMNLPSPPRVMLYDVAAPPPLAYLGPRSSNRK